MTKKINYNFPAEEIRKELKKRKGVVNIVLSENASLLEKIKYNFCQSILAYQQDNNTSMKELAKKLFLPEKLVYDICRGKIDAICLKHLILFVKRLGISYVLCPNCGGNFLGSQDELLIPVLEKYEDQLPETQFIYRNLEKYNI